MAADGDVKIGAGRRYKDVPTRIQDALLRQRQRFEGQVDGNRAYREYVKKCLKALEFYRGNQYSWWDHTSNSYRTTTSSGGGQLANGTQAGSQALYPMNFTQGFILAIVALLTGNKMTTRFFPEDPSKNEDVIAAEKATLVMKIFQKTEGAFEQLRREAFALCTGGTYTSYVRTVTDGERWGYLDEPETMVKSVQLIGPRWKCSVCGDDLNEAPGVCGQCFAPLPPDPTPPVMADLPMPTGTMLEVPRSRTIRDIVDGLEMKLPIEASCQADFNMVVRAREVDKSVPRATWPEIADKIGMATGGSTDMGASSDYERRIRSQANTGTTTENRSILSDDKERITLINAWIRPRNFYTEDDPSIRAELLAMFKKGIKVTWADDVFCEVVEEPMDDHIRVCHALPGRSQVRESIIAAILPIQEMANDILNICRDIIEYTLPATFISTRLLDVRKWARSQVMAGATYNVTDIGKPISEGFHQTAPGQLPEWATQLLTSLRTDIPQFLTGAFPAAYGAGSAGNNALDVETPIPTPNGFVRNGDLQDGDDVFGEDGKVYKVTKTHEIHVDEVYRVVFDDGSSVLADPGHRWLTFSASEREAIANDKRPGTRGKVKKPRIHSRSGSIKTTSQLAETLFDKRGRSNHAIPIAKPFEAAVAELPIDPYVLGVWLGDGTAADGGIACSDEDGPEMAQQFAVAGYPLKKLKTPYVWYSAGLRTKLRMAGLLKNKHVPHAYLWACTEQRLALLQGLMDTDGCATTDGKQFFTNTNKTLIDGVFHLAASLGAKPRILASETASITDRKTGKVYPGGTPIWSVRWTSPLAAFRMIRKAARIKATTANKRNFRYVTDCYPAGTATVRCITVSNPTSLYQFGNNFGICANTAQGIEIERQSALGRVNLFLQALQTHYAEIAPLVVQDFINNAIEPITLVEENFGAETILSSVSPGDFKMGRYRAEAEVVSEYPTTWAQRQALLLQMFQMPEFQGWAALLKNNQMVKRTLGVELTAPKEDAYKLEFRIISKLMREAPQPGPPQPVMDLMTGMPVMDLTGQPMMQPGPPVSSVPVYPLDDNATMLEACADFYMSTDGQRAMAPGPDGQPSPGWQNFTIHVQERQTAMAPPPLQPGQMAPPDGAQAPPPSTTSAGSAEAPGPPN